MRRRCAWCGAEEYNSRDLRVLPTEIDQFVFKSVKIHKGLPKKIAHIDPESFKIHKVLPTKFVQNVSKSLKIHRVLPTKIAHIDPKSLKIHKVLPKVSTSAQARWGSPHKVSTFCIFLYKGTNDNLFVRFLFGLGFFLQGYERQLESKCYEIFKDAQNLHFFMGGHHPLIRL